MPTEEKTTGEEGPKPATTSSAVCCSYSTTSPSQTSTSGHININININIKRFVECR